MGRGRLLFAKHKRIVRLACYCFSCLPRFVQVGLFESSHAFSNLPSLMLRYLYLKVSAQAIGDNVYLGQWAVIKNVSGLTLGDNVSIHASCYLDAAGGITIGDNVSIAHQCSILSFNHTWADMDVPIKYNPIELKRVIIGDDVWIGCGVRIMPGVTIGGRSVVAAGAVVTKDVPPGSLVMGVPARVEKDLHAL